MNLILQIGIIVYLFFVVPFLMGFLEAGIFRKSKKSVSAILTNGYLMMMALFCVVAVVMIRMGQPLSALTRVWVLVTVVTSAAALLAGRRQMADAWKETREFWKREERDDSHGMAEAAGKNSCHMKDILPVVMILSMAVSIGFTRPGAEDGTLETVTISLATDSMYVYNGYTGYADGTAAEGHVFSPVEMLYAVAADAAGMSGVVVLYYFVPVALLLFFFLAFWRLGKQLFGNDGQAAVFELFAVTIYWMTVFLEGQSVVTGIFLNSWNGLTVLSCIVMPLAFGICFEWMRAVSAGSAKVEHRAKHKLEQKTEKAGMIAVLLLAGQLTNEKGGFYIALMLLLTAAVMIVGWGYEYGAASGRFKKRV